MNLLLSPNSILEKLVLKDELAGHNFSSVYLVGSGFKGSWMKKSTAFLCQGRRAFLGGNLFSKGAAYGAVFKEEKPEIRPYVPDRRSESSRSSNKPIRDVVAVFVKWRERQLELIESCEPELWSKPANHPEYTLYTFEILVRHILLHDGFHMYRIEELWLAKDAYLTNM